MQRLMFLHLQGRAKLMFNAGFRTLSAVASADPELLVRSVEHLPRKVAKQIVASAKVRIRYEPQHDKPTK